jgi:hypothetical protein
MEGWIAHVADQIRCYTYTQTFVYHTTFAA